MAIWFHSENVPTLKISPKRELKTWIEQVIYFYDKIPGDINFIFLTDEQLLEINRTYLNHDFFTDVISFDFVSGNTISGDVFISVQRILENAKLYKVDFSEEFLRVIIHGVLHFIGFKDKTDDEKKHMREKENAHLRTVKGVIIISV